MRRPNYPVFLLLLMMAVTAIGATISEVPTAPQPLQSTDKVPMGRQGSTAAYTATMGQINDYVKAQPGTTNTLVDTATKRFTSDSEKAAWNAKQAPLSNAGTLGKIGESNGAPTWNGVAWPGGGEGGTAYFNGRPSPITPQSGDYSAAQVGADPVGTATANMSAHTSSYDHTSIPTSGQKAALAGTSGTPGTGNRYVTDADTRLSNSRAPNAHAASHGAGASDPVTVSTSQVTGLDTVLAGKQAAMSNAGTLGKISEGGNLPLWNGGAWPGGSGSGDMYKATYDPQGKQGDAFDRANHTGTQPAATITGLAPSATTNTTTTANISDSTDKRFVSDAQRTVLGNTSGTNSGNVTLGTSNGLSLVGQQLSLQAATNAQPGALTAADHSTYANAATLAASALQPTGNGSQLTGLTKTQVGLANVDNTSDASKPVSTAQQAALDLKANKDNPTFTTGITTPAVNTNAADGAWRLNVRNTAPRSYTPQEGDMDTDASGKIWLYVSGSWVEKGAAYTPPLATASSTGVVKVGSGLYVDGNGVLSAMVQSVTETGLITAGLFGNQTIRKGFAYIATGNFRATFANISSGSNTIQAFDNYSGRLIPPSGAQFRWLNHIVQGNYSTSKGYSIKIPPNTKVAIDSLGDGVYRALATRNLQKTGVNEYASAGGGGGSSGGTLYAQASNVTGATAVAVSNAAGHYYKGLRVNAGQTAHNVTQVDFYVKTVTGTISAKSFTAVIYTVDGATQNLVTLKGTSAAVSGSAITAGTWVSFTFSTPVTVNAGDAVALTAGAEDTVNYISAAQITTDTDSGYSQYYRWGSDKVYGSSSSSADIAYKLYGL